MGGKQTTRYRAVEKGYYSFRSSGKIVLGLLSGDEREVSAAKRFARKGWWNFQVQVVVTAFDKGRSSLSVVETRRTSEPEKISGGC